MDKPIVIYAGAGAPSEERAGAASSVPVNDRGVPLIYLETIVKPIGRVPEGHLITLIEPAVLVILDALKRNPADRFQIPPRKWEELIAAAYEAAGFDEVILTPASGDWGKDVIATRSGSGGQVRFIDQVKALADGRVVTANDVRALLGVLWSEPDRSVGVVTTTARFAPRIKNDPTIMPFVNSHRLELIDGEQLMTKLESLQRKP